MPVKSIELTQKIPQYRIRSGVELPNVLASRAIYPIKTENIGKYSSAYIKSAELLKIQFLLEKSSFFL